MYKDALTTHKNQRFIKNLWIEIDDAYHQKKCGFDGCGVTDGNDEKPVYNQNGGCTKRGHVHTRSWSTAEWGKMPPTIGARVAKAVISRTTASGGGEGGSVRSYPVPVEQAGHGKVSSNRTRASSGSTVTLTATPNGVMSGKGVDSEGLATRAQAARMLMNFLEK